MLHGEKRNNALLAIKRVRCAGGGARPKAPRSGEDGPRACVQAIAVTCGGTIIGISTRKIKTALPRNVVSPTSNATPAPTINDNIAKMAALSSEFHKARGTERLSSALRIGSSVGTPSAISPVCSSSAKGANISTPAKTTRAARVTPSPPPEKLASLKRAQPPKISTNRRRSCSALSKAVAGSNSRSLIVSSAGRPAGGVIAGCAGM